MGIDRAPRLRTSALTFFLIAIGWSWLFWFAAALGVRDASPTGSLLFLLGGAGPVLTAVVLTQLREPAATRRDFWVRIVDVRRLRWPWWAVALLLHPLIVALAFGVDLALGGPPPVSEPGARSLSAVLGLVVFVLWFGPLPEEMGWRGFALDRLRARMGALPASLVLGSVWALWHLPLFFVPGTYQHGLELGSLRSALFFAAMLPLSVLMTWVYDRTDRSTLSAVLIHYSGNLTGSLVVKTERVAVAELILLVLAAVCVSAAPAIGHRARAS